MAGNMEVEKILPLTPLQEGMLFHALSGADPYVGQMIVDLAGDVHVDDFGKSVQTVADRHEVLRSIVVHKQVKEPKLVVLNHKKVEIGETDFRTAHHEEKAAAYEALLLSERSRGFELAKDTLLRVHLVQWEAGLTRVVLTMHHIALDGWSLSILFTEIVAVYRALRQGKPHGLPPAPPFSAYAHWLARQDRQLALNYWRGLLEGLEAPSALPFARAQTDGGAVDYRELIFRLDAGRTAGLKALAQSRRATLSTCLQAVWGVLLHGYQPGADAVFGAVVSGRPPVIPGIEETVGMFLNTVPVRIRMTDHLLFGELLASLQAQAFESDKHHFAPLHEVQALSPLKQQLIETLMIFENQPFAETLSRQETEALGFRTAGVQSIEHTNYALSAVVYPGQEIEIKLVYDAARIASLYVARMERHLRRIIDQTIADPTVAIGRIELLPDSEKDELLRQFNDTALPYAADRTVHRLFEEQAARTPEATAIGYGDDKLSYRELNERGDRLAYALQQRGVAPGHVVGLLTRRSFQMLIGLIGILKAGAAYLPIDPELPDERIGYMLEDSAAGLVVTESGLADRLPEGLTRLELDRADALAEPGSVPQPLAGPADLAYVIYTSGSTGRPKGVMIEHRTVNNFIAAVLARIPLEAQQSMLVLTTVSFDIFVLETLLPLAVGMRLVIADEDDQREPSRLDALLQREGIDVVQMTPSRLQLLLAGPTRGQGLRRPAYVLLGGEALPDSLLYAVQAATNARIFNMYGPTETTVWSSVRELTRSSAVVVGGPFGNTAFYILDTQLRPVPLGVPGELCIAGEGLARGYWNRDELTTEKFVPHPFKPGARMYRTGDLAKWLPGGDIDYIGRSDFQVKIRGYRIETGEIENELLRMDAVRGAAVTAVEQEGDKQLCAYVIASEADWDADAARRFLRQTLPDYMVPAFFIRLDAFPLTASGKLDRKALPAPDGGMVGGAGEPPTGETEVKLAAIWQSLLPSVPRIGRSDHFFELGGHSLKAASMAAKAQETFGTELPVTDIFRFPRLEELSRRIEASALRGFKGIAPAPKADAYPLTSAQQRIFLLTRLDPDSTAYNMPSAFWLEGEVDISRLEAAFAALTKRHESLRTRFVLQQGQPVQIVQPAVTVMFEPISAEGTTPEDDPLRHEAVSRFVRPFDLREAPLLRAGWMPWHGKGHVLLVDMHHIAADAISLQTLVRELAELYQDGESGFAPLRIQYKDYAVWQRQALSAPAMQEHEAYWLQALRGDLPVLELPTDLPRPHQTDDAGASESFALDAALTYRLRKLAAARQTTLFTVLLAGFQALLARLSGQEDVMVGTPAALRGHADLEPVIGLFINMVPLRSHPSPCKPVDRFLREVRAAVMEGLEHCAYPFDELVEKLGVRRDLSRSPVFDVMFNMISGEGEDIRLGEAALKTLSFPTAASKYDLSLTAVDLAETMVFDLEYKTSLFRADTVKRWFAGYTRLLAALCEENGMLLGDIDIVSDEEKARLLYDFNRTELAYPCDLTIHESFERQARLTPEQPAITFAGADMTYRELDERADRVAEELRLRGAGADRVIGLMVHRSPYMLIGILGILKAGGAYLPIDPELPEERIAYMLEDSGARLLLTERLLALQTAAPHAERLLLEELLSPSEADNDQQSSRLAAEFLDALHQETAAAAESQQEDRVAQTTGPEHLAYVIYTSGSTGKPKGVMIEHRAVNNFIAGILDKVPMASGEAIAVLTTISFDIFVLETLLPLTRGLRLVIADEKAQKDPQLLDDLLLRERVDHVQTTPSRMQLLFAGKPGGSGLRRLRTVMLGGEPVPDSLLAAVRGKTDARIFNMYGPTETTVWSAVLELTDAERSMIGGPIANTDLYVLDDKRRPVPIGAAGELCIGGDGLARGYWGRPELTAERFVPHPFRPGRRLYRTGDLARYRADGTLEFIGRTDFQVKLRGYRIELGEIEEVAAAMEGIAGCAAAVRTWNGHPTLFLFYTGHEAVTSAQIRRHCALHLPDYMVPGRTVRVDRLPLSPAGKLDRGALQRIDPGDEPDRDETSAEPATETEARLFAIWSELLKTDRLGRNDNFFAAGGNSLLLVQMHDRLDALYPGKLQVADLFGFPSIAGLAAHLESLSEAAAWSPQPLPWPADYFGQDQGEQGTVTFSGQLPDVLAEAVREAAAESGVRAEDVLAGVFAVLLSDLSGEAQITLHLMEAHGDRLKPMDVNLERMEDFRQLFREFGENAQRMPESSTVPVRLLQASGIVRKPESLLTLLAFGDRLPQGVSDSFDLIVRLHHEPHRMMVWCEYDAGRIRRDKAETFVSQWIQGLQSLTASLLQKEELT